MKRISWLDHLIGLLVVILGISIAFFLENMRERSTFKKQEKEYIGGLIKDLKTDIEMLDTLIQFNGLILDATSSLSDGSIGIRPVNDTLLANQVYLIQYNPPFTPQRTTYESLKTSGQTNIISDFEMRNQIVELYEQYHRGAQEYDRALSEHVRDYVKPYSINKIAYTSRKTVNDQFLEDGQFRNIIFPYKYLFEAKNEFYKLLKSQTEALIEELEGYNERE